MGDFLKNNDIIRLTDYTLLDKEENEHEMRKFLTKAKKYNPATRKHEVFVEKKLPPHSK